MTTPTSARRKSTEFLRKVKSDPRYVAARAVSKESERELINAKNAFVRATNNADKDAIVKAALAVTEAVRVNNESRRTKQDTFTLILAELDASR